ncbi:MAG: UbiA family prenyltransferase [Candidatus Competibacteraceae bacterium]
MAIHRRRDYADADIPMLPVTHGVAFTRLHILLYTILLFLVTLLPFLTGMSGWIYLAGAVLLGIRFLGYAVRLFATGDDRLAPPTFGFSIAYLFGLFAALMLDHYPPPPVQVVLAPKRAAFQGWVVKSRYFSQY